MNQPKGRIRDSVIDENLQRVFNETLEEGIPDRFKELLSQLKEADAKNGKKNG